MKVASRSLFLPRLDRVALRGSAGTSEFGCLLPSRRFRGGLRNSRVLRHTASLVAFAAFTTAIVRAADADAFPNFESYIKVTGRAASIHGNDAAFEKRTRQHRDGSFGLEDLHYWRALSAENSVTIDMRALSGVEDYLGQVNFSRVNVGSVEAGYKRYRTFYDGIGGFFPLNNFWRPLQPEDLHVDRGRFWLEAKLARPNQPVFSVNYQNETRDGQKSSTIWGDTNLTGLPLLPANNATRKVLPAYLDLDQRHQVLEGRVQHTIAGTTVTLRAIGDWVNNNNTRYMTRFAGEVTPSPERKSYQRDGMEAGTFSAIATTETPFGKKVTLNTGLSFQRVHSTISGERPNAIGVLPTYDFKDLTGGSDADIYTANVSLGLNPAPAWQLRLSLRGEDSYTKSAGSYTRVTGTATAPVLAQMAESSRLKDKILTPEITARYTGWKKIVLYTALSDRIDRGNRRAVSPFNTPVPALSSLADDDIRQDQANYTLGANWNAAPVLTFRAEIFHKDHENNFIGQATNLGQRYVVGYRFTGLKFTGIVKPLPELTFTTRYVPQHGTMDVTTDATARWDSMNARVHLVGETIDWNPTPRTYLQANLNLGFNYISTAYPLAQTPATIAPQRNSDNNYVSGSLVSGFVVDRATNAEVEFTHQHAHNYHPEIATGTQPYGAGYAEYTVTAGLKRKLSDSWMGTLKLGYIESRNDTTGGNTNFRGPLAYVSVEHGL